MAKSPYQVAKDRKKDLLQEIEKIEEFLKMYDTLKADGADGDASKLSDGGKGGGEKNLSASYNKPADALRVAEDVLREAGRPMKRGELWEEVSKRGIRLNSNDPVNLLGTTLWRAKDRFEQTEDGYQLKSALHDEDKDDPSEDRDPPGEVHREGAPPFLN